MKLAMLCPGQGSQTVGMGRPLMVRYPIFDDMLQQASDRMSVDLGQVVRKGPPKLLQTTRLAQVAIFVFSAGIGRILRDAGVSFDAAAGHSLGEISALHLAGAIDFEDALDLVIARAEAMEYANGQAEGGMSAIMGELSETLMQICSDAGVSVCNFNTVTQTVISGEVTGLAQAEAALKDAGYRVRRLQVAGAYHSPLMAPAVAVFEDALDKCTFHVPEIPVISNVTGIAMAPEDDLRVELLSQVTSPVLWRDCMNALVARRTDTFVEVGFGKHLKGLAIQNTPTIPCFGTSTPGEIQAIIDAEIITGAAA